MDVVERADGTLEIITSDPTDTRRLGYFLGTNTDPPTVIALVGELGSGKTVLTQGIAAGLGVSGQVRSPSFCVINEYAGSPPLYHFDCYRLRNTRELEALGYHEYFFDPGAVVVVEWADLVRTLLPSAYLEIIIEMTDLQKRRIVLVPRGVRYHRLASSVLGGVM